MTALSLLPRVVPPFDPADFFVSVTHSARFATSQREPSGIAPTAVSTAQGTRQTETVLGRCAIEISIFMHMQMHIQLYRHLDFSTMLILRSYVIQL